MRILYLDLDTLRADHLGCYGYARNLRRTGRGHHADTLATRGPVRP